MGDAPRSDGAAAFASWPAVNRPASGPLQGGMSRAIERMVALAAGCALAGAVALALPVNPLEGALLVPTSLVVHLVWPGTQALLDRRAPERHERVRAELGELGDHPWAGIYRTGALAPTVLAIAPRSGFTLREGSRCGFGSGWRALGRVLSAQGPTLGLELELALDRPAEGERYPAWYGLEPTLHLVRWGDLLFAVPPWRMELFCAEVSDGRSFPLVPFRRAGSPPDADFEPAARPEGRPDVPAEYAPLILDEPIEATLRSLIEWRHRYTLPWSGARMFDAIYEADAGARDGVARGMHFHDERGADGCVDLVGPETSRVRYLMAEDGAAAAARVGSRVSTSRLGPPR